MRIESIDARFVGQVVLVRFKLSTRDQLEVAGISKRERRVVVLEDALLSLPGSASASAARICCGCIGVVPGDSCRTILKPDRLVEAVRNRYAADGARCKGESGRGLECSFAHGLRWRAFKGRVVQSIVGTEVELQDDGLIGGVFRCSGGQRRAVAI